MNLDDLKKRIEKWEDVHTEFKEWPINNVSCAESLVAFANTDGGQFVIGVSNDKQFVGVADPDRVMQWVDNIAYNNCEPPVTVVQETVKSQMDVSSWSSMCQRAISDPIAPAAVITLSAPHQVDAWHPARSCCACFRQQRASTTTRLW